MPFLKQFTGRLRALWRVLTRSRQLERDMQDEMRFHVEMEADRLVRDEGIDPQEARRQAHVRFGGVEAYKEAARDARGRRWLDALLVDARNSVRMLFKYKGLTLVGGLAMAVAIGIGATAFEILGEMLTTSLPFEGGDRIVSIRYENVRTGSGNALLDLFDARKGLTSLDELAAFRTVQHNLSAPPARPVAIKIAQITAAGLALANTRPILGRSLEPSDEDPASPPVLVLSHRAWQSEFASDPNAVGRAVALGGVAYTVVGVMPEGFGFPLDHQYWIPFPLQSLTQRWASGPTVYVFGKLADGVSRPQAEAELTAVLQPKAPVDAASPPVAVVPYTLEHVDLSDLALMNVVKIARLLTGALAFVVAINLAILFHARTVTRAGELAIRTALGASRARLLAQLFLEALALSLVGAAAGLLASSLTLRYLHNFSRAVGGVPYWIQFDLSPAAAANAFVLAALTALIVGVVPGVKATGGRVTAALGGLANDRSAPRLGRVWTAMVITQVAVAVAVLPVACFVTWQTLQIEIKGPGFDAGKFIVSRVALPDDDGPADERRVAEDLRQLMTELRREPGVGAVTFSTSVPGFATGAQIEFVKGTPVSAPAPWYISRIDVAPDMLDVYETTVLAGRRFNGGDVGAAHTVVVNESFTKWLPGGVNALGARFRYVATAGRPAVESPLYEIVGVVRDFPEVPEALNLDTPAVVFHAAALGAVNPVFLSLRFDRGLPPDGIGQRIREVSMSVDPALQVRAALPLDRYYDQVYSLWRTISWTASMATLSGLLLSAAGMYALMSFAVAQRTREIGIRVALGARPRRLFMSIFGRAFRQIAVGIVIGTLFAALAVSLAGLGLTASIGILAAVATIMLIVGLAAAIGPARRSLRVQPVEALRS